MPALTTRTLLASAAQVADGVGAAIDLGVDTSLDLDLTVLAIAGTLTVIVETSKNATVGWTTVAMAAGDEASPVAFAVVSAPSLQSVTFTDLERYVRVRWTLTGTATFSVTGNSVRVYCKTTDLPSLGIHTKHSGSVSSVRKDAAIREVTDRVDAALAMFFEPPLDTWGYDIRGGTAACSTVILTTVNGMRPGQDELVAKRCMAFDAWLDLVALGKRRPAGAIDKTPDELDGTAHSTTEAKRGW